MAKIVGYIWIILGIIWILRPGAFRERLRRKASRKLRRVFYGALFIFGIAIAGSLLRINGFLPRVMGILGILLIFKSLFLYFSRASDKLWEWWGRQPLPVFRLQALGVIIIGALLVALG